MPSRLGRPSLLEDSAVAPRIEELLRLVGEACLSAAGACRASGISQSTLYGWLERATGPDASPWFVEFSERFARARGERERQLVDAILGARLPGRNGQPGPPDWRAHAWLLERLEPGSYGRTNRVELGGEVTTKLLQVDVRLPEDDGAARCS